MKWKGHIQNETRVIKRFAFFPIRINSEVVWLEFCKIKQTYYDDKTVFGYWTNMGFVR